MNNDFKEIEIKDFEYERNCARFILSETPPYEWHSFFEENRRFPRHNMWRIAEIEGDVVVIKCGIDERETQFRDLKQDVEYANNRYSKYIKEEEQRKQIQKQKLDEERAEKDRIVKEFKEKHSL